jgi:hypothetical protein
MANRTQPIDAVVTIDVTEAGKDNNLTTLMGNQKNLLGQRSEYTNLKPAA